MNLKRFLKNIEQTVFEGMVKIGYLKGSPSQVYYDRRLLSFLLEEDLTLEEGYEALNSQIYTIQPDYPDLTFQKQTERICCYIGAKTMELIHERNQNNSFLISLVHCMETRQARLEEVVSIFQNTGLDYVMKEVNNPEFSHIFHFTDPNFDEYFYCFYFDKMGSYYHRLLAFELV